MPLSKTLRHKLAKNNPAALARYWLLGEINRRLRQHVQPLMYPSQVPELAMLPLTIMGVLYGVLALELAQPLQPVDSCIICHEEFTPTRAGRLYCGNPNCRQVASRRRRAGEFV